MSQYQSKWLYEYVSHDFGACKSLLEEYFEPIGYRYIGVHIGSLKDAIKIVEQMDLFAIPVENTDSILNQLNEKWIVSVL